MKGGKKQGFNWWLFKSPIGISILAVVIVIAAVLISLSQLEIIRLEPEGNWVDVCTASDLSNVRNNLNGKYRQTCDIDLSGRTWTPIAEDFWEGAFTGIYNGKGFKITGLKVRQGSNVDMEEYAGLFGVSRGEIKNVNLIGVSVKGGSGVGGLVGRHDEGVIDNCFVSGKVFGDIEGGIEGTESIGGLVGYNNLQSEISNSEFVGTVAGGLNVGGFAGGNGGIIRGSSSLANVTGAIVGGPYLGSTGGFVGTNHGKIINCDSSGNVTGKNSIGGFVGQNSGTNLGSRYPWTEIINSSSSAEVSGWGGVGGFVGDNDNVISGCFSIGNVIGLTFQGGGFLIGGFAGINGNDSIARGVISDSYAIGNVTGTNDVGGFAGWSGSEAEIYNSYSTGNTLATSFSSGGFVGHVSDFGLIESCFSTGNVIGTYDAGGFTGGIHAGTVLRSYSTGNVTGTNDVGGFAGYVEQGLGGFSFVEDCFSTGNVTGSLTNVGGFSGRLSPNCEISNSYSTGEVGGISSGFIGGFLGKKAELSTVTSSYWDKQTSGVTTSAGGVGKTTGQMKTQVNYVGWDFANVWDIVEGVNYPSLIMGIVVPPANVCGDGNCVGMETCSTCEADCGVCPPVAPVCGDGNCDAGEDCLSCEIDCGVCPTTCGDGNCEIGETSENCLADCQSPINYPEDTDNNGQVSQGEITSYILNWLNNAPGISMEQATSAVFRWLNSEY